MGRNAWRGARPATSASGSRRRWSRALGVALGVVLTVAVPGTATAGAAGDQQTRGAAPVGLWSGTINFTGAEVEATMSFRADGTMCALQPPGPDGGADGSGRWWRTGPSAFAFRGLERFFNASGTTTGYLRFSHQAVLVGPAEFTSTGQGTYYDADGMELGTTPATAHLRKVSGQSQPC
ncbi:hypothetical protein [Streptomyces sp. NPDC046862]|uniref:hypothetical protein n=1 Tax=Streptomyces sp. NPDC046862 TaxID=3154603 RepID=UPI0034549E78